MTWYDEPELMSERLDVKEPYALDAFHTLKAARHVAYYKRKERLRDWIVLGRWSLDTCGNTALITEGACPGGPWFVETPEQFRLRQGEDRYTSTFGTWIPTSEHRCGGCGVGWTLRSCWDAIQIATNEELHRELPPRYEHEECCRARLARETLAAYRKALEVAGYTDVDLQVIPNEYWSRDHPPYYAEPWVQFAVDGGVIKLGWRKRVVHIEWSGAELQRRVQGETVFADVRDTKGGAMVHAWKLEQVGEYLLRIAVANGGG
jgi:hypothetical protein